MAPALPDPQTFEQVVALIGERREIGLQMDVERYVKPVSFKPSGRVYVFPDVADELRKVQDMAKA